MALALMRRHRRWLYVFLWLVIAAFIILYIPAFQKGQDAGTPGETVVSVGGLPVSVGEMQRAYTRQRQVYERMYQGRLDEAMLRQLGLEEQVLDVARRRTAWSSSRPSASASRVSDDAVARAIATAPEFQDNGTLHRHRRDPPPARPARHERGAVRATRCAGSCCARACRTWSARPRRVSDAEVERELPRPQRAGEARVRARRRRALPAAGPADGRRGRRPASTRRRTPTRSPRSASSPTCCSTARPCSRRSRSTRPRHRALLPGPPRGVPPGGGGVRQPHPGQGAGRATPARATPTTRRRRSPRSSLDEVKAGGDFAAIAKKSSEDQGSAANGGDLGCFAPGRMVPRVRRRGVRAASRASCPSSSRPRSATTSSASPRRRRRRCCRSPQVKERIRADGARPQDERARRAEGAGAGGRARARASRSRRRRRRRGSRCRRARRSRAARRRPPLASPTLVARVVRR